MYYIILIFIFSRECFVTLDEMEVAKKFKLAINRTFSENGGVFWQSVSDDQLTRYIMALVKDFSSNRWKVFCGSLTTGRQQNLRRVNHLGHFEEDDDADAHELLKDDYDSSVYILNEKLQVRVEKVTSINKYISSSTRREGECRMCEECREVRGMLLETFLARFPAPKWLQGIFHPQPPNYRQI